VNKNINLLDQLTICSVSFKSNELLNLNLKTMLRLNKIEFIKWIVVDNNIGIRDWEQPALSSDFKVIDGQSNSFSGKVKGSYHHAQALNNALRYISTRFLLVLDPDFFIIRPDWIKQVLNHMLECKLSFFGAPYHPSYVNKTRYFPCAICILIDLEKVNKDNLDFTPELYEYLLLKEAADNDLFRLFFGLTNSYQKQLEDSHVAIRHLVLQTLRNRHLNYKLRGKFPDFVCKNINVTRDTGYKVYYKYHSNWQHKYESLNPAFINPLYANAESGLIKKIFYPLIPESLSKYPLHQDYTTDHFFRDFNLPDIEHLGWEEYFWQNKPFGFHIKGATSKEDLEINHRVDDLLDQF
jgi:hypothetical protein